MYLPERRREGRLSLRGWVDGGRGTLGGRDAGLLGPGRRGLLQGDHGAFINRKMVEIPTNDHVYWYYSTQSERHWLTNDQWFHQSLSTLWHCPHVRMMQPVNICSLGSSAAWTVCWRPGSSPSPRARVTSRARLGEAASQCQEHSQASHHPLAIPSILIVDTLVAADMQAMFWDVQTEE